MKRRTTVRIFSIALCCLMLFAQCMVTDAAESVALGKKAYEVDLDAATPVFLGNKKAVDFSGGEAVYLTYTVDSAKLGEAVEYVQNGVIASQNREEIFPYYEVGLMNYGTESVLLKEGYTYFFKFQITKLGFECVAACAKDKENKYINFPEWTGSVMEGMKYAGVWFVAGETGEGITGKLTNVRCYDQKGNDLGVGTNNKNLKNGVTIYDPTIPMEPNAKVKHSYEFELKDAYNVAISNKKATNAKVIYMEYKVKDSKNNINQTGLEMSNSPLEDYPHGRGAAYLNYETDTAETASSVLAISGASYIVRFERGEDRFEGLVKYTLNGETRHVKFSQNHGKYSQDYEYFNLWFGDGGDHKISAKFLDFKCYDGAGNNLGVQTNEKVEVIRYGGIEDYSACKAVYYCKENDTFISLKDEQVITKQVDGSEDAITGSYMIDGTTLTMKVEDTEETYTYFYRYMKDEAGNEYIRLKESKVKFVNGKDKKEEIASAAESFKVKKPANPTSKYGTFKAWCMGDGTEFDFEEVVTENITLYAKWVDGNGNEYLAVKGDGIDIGLFLGIGICLILIAGTTVGVIRIAKGDKKHGKK